jgi:MFS family permease
LSARAWRLLLLAGLAASLGEFDGAALPLALPAISAEFHAPLAEISNLGSLLLLGGLVALPMAVFADRTGRSRLVAVGVLGFSLADLASAFAGSIPALAACRLVAVAFEALVASIAPVLAIEEVPDQHRALGVAGLTFIATAGGGATTILYPFLAPHWRVLYLLGGVGVPVAVLIWFALPESRAWTASSRAHAPLRLLLQAPWRRRLAILGVSSLLAVIFYEPASLYGVLYGSRSLHLAPAPISVILVASGWVGAAGFLAGGWLSDRFGRRLLAVGLGAAAALASSLAYAGGLPAYVAGYLAGPLLVGMAGPILVAWSSELYPTRARATAETFNLGAGTIGGVIGLQLVSLAATRFGLGPALVASAAGLFAGALVLLALPETRGQPLPD